MGQGSPPPGLAEPMSQPHVLYRSQDTTFIWTSSLIPVYRTRVYTPRFPVLFKQP